jgi:hypothetical protein
VPARRFRRGDDPFGEHISLLHLVDGNDDIIVDMKAQCAR